MPLPPSTTLVRSVRNVAWELRFAWARGLRVSLTVDGDTERVEGLVSHVSPTDGFAVVDGQHVPLERLLAVHRPSRLGDSNWRDGERWAGRVPDALRRDPNQLQFNLEGGD